MHNVTNKKSLNTSNKNTRNETAINGKQYKQIEILFQYIEKMTIQIQRIHADTNMSIVDKQRKIGRCQENINNYKEELKQTLETIKQKNYTIYSRFMSRLEKQR